MAGIEQLEIHSKSYLMRWINVPTGHTISWSIQPHKKGINFGIFKHPGGNPSSSAQFPSSATFEPISTPQLDSSKKKDRSENSTVMEKLQSIGLKAVSWHGKCEGDKVTMGKFDVTEGEGGMYGLCFDNTFSKQVSKTATFVLMTYPSNAPPISGSHLHFSQASSAGSTTNLAAKPQSGLALVNDSTDSLGQQKESSLLGSTNKSSNITEFSEGSTSTFFTGVLQKKRRKHHQGYARRFFSLDLTSSTLSYYRNNHSSALRGAIPLSLAAIGTNESSREISVDSGAEVWQLRANNKREFAHWRSALEKAAVSAAAISTPVVNSSQTTWTTAPANPAEEREWNRIETLIGRVAGTRDAVRRLAQDTDPKYMQSSVLPTFNSFGIKSSRSATSSPTESSVEALDYFRDDDKPEKMPFWKRKASSSGTSPAGLFRRSVSAQMAAPSPSSVPPVPPLPNGHLSVPKRRECQESSQLDEGVHENCMAILRDLDQVVAEFSALLSENRSRRMQDRASASRRMSIDSTSSQEFFDATDGDTMHSALLTIRRDSDEGDDKSDVVSDGDSATSSEADRYDNNLSGGPSSLFPSAPKSLSPLPLDRVKRRRTIPPAKVAPPSLIGFLRKNVGKDLSTIAMPVSANEPTSLIQRFAEEMEYSELLDAAASATSDECERLLQITAFAISNFSNSRVKERAIRKPFNPMLGETFELVREDKGFRFIAEKVSHRPVRMACQAESQNWTFMHSPMPVQKFWGKSVELNTDGRTRILLHTTNERFSWTMATSFLRNIIAGEKYVEPVNTMTIVNETTGAKAVATFKAGGMFAGRSEDVTVAAYDHNGRELPLGMVGRWTTFLNVTKNGSDTGRSIWTVGSLVDNAPVRYGFTTFAASLNEITSVESGHLPPTDSRLRPDQRAAEDGDLDRAEGLKARLEERQRARRRVMEEHGEKWVPRWFVKVSADAESEEIWRLKTGKDGYWEERNKGEWKDVVEVFEN